MNFPSVEVSFTVRFAETDAQGVVHHANYLVYFEEARSAHLRHHGRSYAEMEREGYLLMVTDVNIRYIKAAVYDQCLTVRVQLIELKSRALTYQYEVLNPHGELLVTGTTKHICVNRQGQISTIPREWRDLVQPKAE
jgi:acyl-CoA thioester hydrolase